jgi:hypothetical protein
MNTYPMPMLEPRTSDAKIEITLPCPQGKRTQKDLENTLR